MELAGNSATLRVLQAEQPRGKLPQRGGALLHQRFQFGLVAPEFFLHQPAFCHLGLERLCFLLQLSNAAQALVFTDQLRVALVGNYARVFRADFQQQFALLLMIETGHGVGAVETEGSGFRQRVPKLFETDRSLRLSFRPQKRDHFPERGNPGLLIPMGDRHFCDHIAHQGSETPLIRPSIDHEL